MKIGLIIKYLIFLLVFQSCSNAKKKDLIGNWVSIPINNTFPSIWQVTFNENDAYVMDDYGFVDEYSYDVNNKSLRLENGESKFDTIFKIVKLKSDSIELGNISFRKVTDRFYLDKIHYSLIGIETNSIVQSFESNIPIMHLTKSTDKGMQLRFNDKYADLKNLPMLVSTGHHFQPKIIIFIGENVGLKEIQEIHYNLFPLNKVNITYVVDKPSINSYAVFSERIWTWSDELSKYFKDQGRPPAPPMPYGMNSKQEFLANGGLLIEINSIEEVAKLDIINSTNEYLILIDITLSFPDYFIIKRSVSEITTQKNKRIITMIKGI